MRPRLLPFCLLLASILPAAAQDVANNPQGEQIPGPSCSNKLSNYADRPIACLPAEAEDYLKDIQHWRNERRIRAGLDDALYNLPALQWTQSSFIQPQMMVHDRYFYDSQTQQYTVDRYLNDLNTRYGGIDSVLIWHTYPNLGIDDRNQYDFFRDLPGGIDGVRNMVADFHKHNIRVLFPVMVWDQGTRPEGISDAEAMARELAAVNADGINGDTLDGMPRSFLTASEALNHPLALEPEVGVSADEMLNDNPMTWGYWTYNFIPSVSRYKWLQTRHMVNICNRWAHDHHDDLQQAFFNGTGFESWENVWGIWNQLTDRDAEALRRVSAIERQYQEFLVSPDWEPHTPTLRYGVFASKWPRQQEALWTIVNRNSYAVSGEQLSLPHQPGVQYYDLWHGKKLEPRTEGDHIVLSFDLDAYGYGAILATTAPTPQLTSFLATMGKISAKPLSEYSNQWHALPQQIVPIAASAGDNAAADDAPMIKIPEANFTFRVNGVEIEGGDDNNDEGVDVQYPWEPSARRYHQHTLHIQSFLIDKYPVTNSEYKKFIDASGYKPADTHNYLRDWKNGTYPEGWAGKPVTWISLEDARAYAKWAGKRLPHEWEWQYAAQGTDNRTYPWGNDYPSTFNANSPIPQPDTGRTMQPAADVNAHPSGASPFGVMDMVGNVWQWTEEFEDTHTRAAILRGGSHYQPQGSRWYFPQAYRLDEHGKYLLMAPSLDRSGAVGFRCVRDLP